MAEKAKDEAAKPAAKKARKRTPKDGRLQVAL